MLHALPSCGSPQNADHLWVVSELSHISMQHQQC